MSQKLRGFVGQNMAGRKSARVGLVALSGATAAGTGSYTATAACTLLVYGWGAGGSGAASGGNPSGAGGGGAGFRHLKVVPGQIVSWSIGAGGAAVASGGGDGFDGADTTITLPNGALLRAGGGKKGAASGLGGLGGVLAGSWDVARPGGKGGDFSMSGESPVGGGTGGLGAGAGGGGGGSAGFTDTTPGLPAGDGGGGNRGSVAGLPGGGSGGNTAVGDTFVGGDGRVTIYALKVSA